MVGLCRGTRPPKVSICFTTGRTSHPACDDYAHTDTVFHISFAANGTGYLEIGESLHFRLAGNSSGISVICLWLLPPFVHLFRSVRWCAAISARTICQSWSAHESGLPCNLHAWLCWSRRYVCPSAHGGFVHVFYKSNSLFSTKPCIPWPIMRKPFWMASLESTSDGHPSPTDFMDEPSSRSTPWNLPKSQRGILHTT